jgi:hypothetical protein
MPYDQTKPAKNSAHSSAEMRGQLQALNAEIQNRTTHTELGNDICGASSNSNGVGRLDNG